MPEAYIDNLANIRDEMARLDLLIQRAVRKTQETHKKGEHSGLYISEKEIDSLLFPDHASEKSPESQKNDGLGDMIQKHMELINQKVSESLKKGKRLQLPRLARIFELSPFEMDVIMICLAPELNLKYRRIYGYLQDDITKTHPSIDLILKLLCLNFEEIIHARRFFSLDSTLLKYRILSFIKDPSEISVHFPAQQVKLDERISRFLLMSNDLDYNISPFCSVIQPSEMKQDQTLSGEIRSKIINLTLKYLEGENHEHLIFYFYGPDSEGKKRMAESVCSAIRLPLLWADMRGMLSRENDFERLMCLVFREGLMQPSAVCVDHMDDLWDKGEKTSLYITKMQDLFRKMGWVIFLSGKRPWPHFDFKEEDLFFEFEFPVPPYPIRKQYWELSLNGNHPLAEDVDLDTLAGKFRFTRSQIHNAVIGARNRAFLRDEKGFKITGDDLYAASRSQSNQRLISFGQKILPKYTWEDIVLPGDILAHLKELCAHVAFHSRVYGEWGFDRKHNLGKGLNILFSGASGTGKTMAAEIIANELQLDLYKIDLSTVVSKYIGETEKNLSKIFAEAETSNAILFFDEADALFGKRSEVKDSHDRYANIEINYLLQKMEEHEGIVILATNLSKNIDEAFLRRMHFSVNFPFPEKEERMLIWKGIFPKEVPLAKGIDFRFLSKQLDISGGSIKNIALRSAFMAARDSGDIKMKHIMLAAKREFQKMGRLCLETDFKKYHQWVKQGGAREGF